MKLKGNGMDAEKNRLAGRRGFIFTITGLFSGFLLAKPTPVRATKTKIKKLLGNLEAEMLEASRSTRASSIVLKNHGDTTTLYEKGDGKTRPLCSLNPTGRTIWERCNGKNTPRVISKLVHQEYSVSPHQAYLDCLTFLARLRTMGAIQV